MTGSSLRLLFLLWTFRALPFGPGWSEETTADFELCWGPQSLRIQDPTRRIHRRQWQYALVCFWTQCLYSRPFCRVDPYRLDLSAKQRYSWLHFSCRRYCPAIRCWASTRCWRGFVASREIFFGRENIFWGITSILLAHCIESWRTATRGACWFVAYWQTAVPKLSVRCTWLPAQRFWVDVSSCWCSWEVLVERLVFYPLGQRGLKEGKNFSVIEK